MLFCHQNQTEAFNNILNCKIMINKLKIFLSLLIIVFTTACYADQGKSKSLSVNEIFEKAAQFKGLKKYSSLDGFTVKGYLIDTKGKHNNFDFYFLKPDFSRFKLLLGMFPFNVVMQGDSGWTKHQGMAPFVIDNFQKHQISILKSVLINDFFNYEANGDSIIYIGKEKVTGVDCYKLKIIDNRGIHKDIFIASDNFRIIKFFQIKQIGTENLPFEIYYENYRDFGGVQYPTSIESYTGDKEFKLKIELINYDSGINEFDFRKPN